MPPGKIEKYVPQSVWFPPAAVAPKIRPRDDVRPEAVYEDLDVVEIDPTTDFTVADAAQKTVLFPLFGGLSVLVAGVLSDRLGKSGRAIIIFLDCC